MFKVFLQALQGMQLATDALTERANCFILDVSGGEKKQCRVTKSVRERYMYILKQVQKLLAKSSLHLHVSAKYTWFSTSITVLAYPM